MHVKEIGLCLSKASDVAVIHAFVRDSSVMGASQTRWAHKSALLSMDCGFPDRFFVHVCKHRCPRSSRQSTCTELRDGYGARANVSDIHQVAVTLAMNANRRRILVADCHDDTLIILEKLLEDAGFDTTTVWTANDALKLLDSHVFDLVLISKYLPDAKCQELLKELHKRCEAVACIVMLPSEPEMNDFTSLQALGVREVLCKRAYRQIFKTVKEYLACDPMSHSAA